METCLRRDQRCSRRHLSRHAADGSFASDVAQLRQKMDRLEAIVAPGRVPSAASSDAALSLGTMEHPQQRDSTARSAVTAAREMLEDARRTLEEDGSCHSLGIRSGKGSGAGVGPDGAERGDVKTKAGHAGSDADRDSREERAGTKGLDEDETGSRGVAGDTAASPRRGEGLVVLAVGHRRALSPSDRVGRDMGRRGGHVGVFAMKGSRVDGEEGAERGVKGADGREEEDTGRGDGGETRVVEVEDGTQEREGGEQSPSAGTEREARTGEEARGTVRDLLEMEGSTGEKAATVVVEGMMGGSADVARLVLVGGGLFLAGVVVGAMLLGSVVWDGESLGHGVGHEEAASVGSLNNS